MDNPLDFLEGEPSQEQEPVAETPVVETPPAEAQTPEAEPAAAARERGPDGKFAPKAAEAKAEPETPPKAPSQEEVTGFYKAMQEERDRRQAAEARAKALEDRIAAQQPPPAPLEPTQALEAALYTQKLDISRAIAEQKYGADTVAKVHAWAEARCDADPNFNQQMRSARLPYEAAFRAYETDRVINAVQPGELDAFLAWKAAQAEAGAQPQTPQPAEANTPPRSLASAPGNGLGGRSTPPMEQEDIFASVIK